MTQPTYCSSRSTWGRQCYNRGVMLGRHMAADTPCTPLREPRRLTPFGQMLGRAQRRGQSPAWEDFCQLVSARAAQVPTGNAQPLTFGPGYYSRRVGVADFGTYHLGHGIPDLEVPGMISNFKTSAAPASPRVPEDDTVYGVPI